MNLNMNKEALQWYKKELDLEQGDHIRFFVRYGGCSSVQKGFSLGISKDEPQRIGASLEVDGITFFVEESDIWYFDGHDLLVTYHESAGEPMFEYQ
ncbi:hypothetical protein HOO54_11920 [Bacillus sp. WMMC1349]|nr:HesB/YadR/YfhF family protein [Bacillus sp. WMMC1349]NPC92915.1 hypothetical protein [Bacillus sp. WMMC1349]